VSGITIGTLRREIAEVLAPISPTAGVDARLLVAHALGTSADELVLRDDSFVEDAAYVKARHFARRRAAGEPVARIVGMKEFYGITLALSPDTLVPRPDTETLVDAALSEIKRDEPVNILDLGTGSGAILLALLSELPRGVGVGIDNSAGAIFTASGNAKRLGFQDRANFVVGDWTKGLAGAFDIVVANPPYIATGEIASLPVEVRDFDPHLSLDGGADGHDAYRIIIGDLSRVLARDGAAFLEVGFGQAAAVIHLAGTAGFATRSWHDLSGVERVIEMRRDPARKTTVG
jgi:release factor glutamine methyltransferase